MISVTYFLDIIKLSIAGIIAFSIAWLIIKNYLQEVNSHKSIELRKLTIEKTLHLRLQAYERVILFVERINPENMFIRLHVSGMSAEDMQRVILTEIRAEYQHNITQQLYVSNGSWILLRKLKDDTIGMVNSALKSLPQQSSGMDLSKAILNYLGEQEADNPYELALAVIKRDIQQLF